MASRSNPRNATEVFRAGIDAMLSQVWLRSVRSGRMTKPLDELVALLRLEQLAENRFRGESQDPGWGTVFGGQVLGQALSAAIATVAPDRHVHSLHAYFLRPGDVSRPIVYEVDRIRDG